MARSSRRRATRGEPAVQRLHAGWALAGALVLTVVLIITTVVVAPWRGGRDDRPARAVPPEAVFSSPGFEGAVGGGPPPADGVTPAAPALPTDGAAGGRTMGFSAGELIGLSPAALNARVAAMAATGATWTRWDIPWPAVQPDGPDSWDWSLPDRVLAAMNAHGLYSLPILDYTPAWARVAGCGVDACAPARTDDFVRFATAAVTRYAPAGVRAWEIWNEPNLAFFWAPNPDADAYAALLKAVTRAIHAAQPGAVVLAGGLAPAQTVQGQVHPVDFLRRIYDTAGAASFDGVAMHPYSFPALPADGLVWSGWSQLNQLRSLMVARGDSAKGIWITEFGAPTGGKGSAVTLAARRYDRGTDHVDEAFQAQTAKEGWAQAAAATWIHGFFWYSFADLGTDPDKPEDHLGIVRADGSLKPSYGVLRDAFQSAR